jgi:hypothetical protein
LFLTESEQDHVHAVLKRGGVFYSQPDSLFSRLRIFDESYESKMDLEDSENPKFDTIESAIEDFRMCF